MRPLNTIRPYACAPSNWRMPVWGSFGYGDTPRPATLDILGACGASDLGSNPSTGVHLENGAETPTTRDATPPTGRAKRPASATVPDVLLALLPVIASFESQRRSERVRVAMQEIKSGRRRTRSGRPPGRPRRVTAELAEKIRGLRERGLPWKVIAQHVGLPAGTCRKVRVQPPARNSVCARGSESGLGAPSA